jgi:LPS-assembly lipoprotein
MSSLNAKNVARLAAIAGLTIGLSACFRPLYGPTASGESLQAVMASIDVPENQLPDSQSQVEHYLRSELIFNLNGSGVPEPKKYRLVLNYNQGLSTPIVDSVSGRALSATVTGTLNFTLTSLDGTKVITTGKAVSSATYDRFRQRFASVRAARDAEIRVAKDLAQQLRTQIAAALATRT